MINITEVVIKTFTNASPTVKMEITHKPTGISVSGSGKGRRLLKKQLMNELNEKVKNHD